MICFILFYSIIAGHFDTGHFSFSAKNKWGSIDTAADLTIMLKPEFEGPKDCAAIPGEPSEFSAFVRACPPATVTWYVL